MSEELPEGTKTCGTCGHAKPCPDGRIDCYGAPPTPVLLGSRPARLGMGVELQIEVVRPHLEKNIRACGSFKPALMSLDVLTQHSHG